MGAGKEENGGGCGTTAPASEGRIRIYIGGLGGSVSADDLKKTFSTPQLGNVDSVEIVRTKGRSIAYLDFIPVSDKGLAKLFSTVSILSLFIYVCFMCIVFGIVDLNLFVFLLCLVGHLLIVLVVCFVFLII